MLDPKKFNAPSEVVSTRREAILNAARDAQALNEETVKTQLDHIAPCIPTRGFPIVLSTKMHTSTR